MTAYITIIVFIGLGLLAQRLSWLPTGTPQKLNWIVIHVAIPALILLRLPSLQLSWDLLLPVLTPWCGTAVIAVLSIALCRWRQWSRETEGALLIVAALGNTSFLGLPMSQTFFGEGPLPYAIIYDQMGSFLLLAVYAPLVGSLYSQSSQLHNSKPRRHYWRALAGKILSFPPLLALVAALILPLQQLPNWLESPLQIAAATLVPLTMFIVGLQWRLKIERQWRLPLLYGLTVKMLIMPMLCVLALQWIEAPTDMAQVVAFQAAMPPMVSAAALAISLHLAAPLCAALTGFGLVLALLWLPLWFYILQLAI